MESDICKIFEGVFFKIKIGIRFLSKSVLCFRRNFQNEGVGEYFKRSWPIF